MAPTRMVEDLSDQRLTCMSFVVISENVINTQMESESGSLHSQVSIRGGAKTGKALLITAVVLLAVGNVVLIVMRYATPDKGMDQTTGDTSPDDTPPDDTSPDDTPPDDTPPDDTSPDDTPPDDTSPDDTPPDDTSPDDTPPDDDTSPVVSCDSPVSGDWLIHRSVEYKPMYDGDPVFSA